MSGMSLKFTKEAKENGGWVPPPPPPWAQKLLKQRRERDADGAPNDFVRLLRAVCAGNTEEVFFFFSFFPSFPVLLLLLRVWEH